MYFSWCRRKEHMFPTPQRHLLCSFSFLEAVSLTKYSATSRTSFSLSGQMMDFSQFLYTDAHSCYFHGFWSLLQYPASGNHKGKHDRRECLLLPPYWDCGFLSIPRTACLLNRYGENKMNLICLWCSLTNHMHLEVLFSPFNSCWVERVILGWWWSSLS